MPPFGVAFSISSILILFLDFLHRVWYDIGMKHKMTTQEFISRSIEKHGLRYDYSKSIYTVAKNKVIIICKIHGEFEQVPHQHIYGHDCPECAKGQGHNKLKLSIDTFIERSHKVHGDKYDYSKVEWKNNYTPITITCKIHGDFEQIPTNHLAGRGCKQCGYELKKLSKPSTIEKLKESKTRTKEEFISDARKVHGDKYEYSKVEYVTSTRPIIITCKTHGDFSQTPISHTQGRGCQKCARINVKELSKINGEKTIIENGKFIVERFSEVHGNTYDYSKVVYTGIHEKVIIICKKHGEFSQSPTTHLKCGCPKCQSSKGERAVRKILEEMNIEFVEQKSFPTCKNVKPLRFDFWIEKYNLLIEYDGIQHFDACLELTNSLDFHKQKLEYVKLKDEIKTKWCLDNNVKLLRIRYDDNIRRKIYECFLEFLR